MKKAEEARADSKLDMIAHYLLRTFPGATIRAAGGSGGDVQLTVCPAGFPTTATLHIMKAFLSEQHPPVEEIPRLLDQLDLSRVLVERGQYALRPTASPTKITKTTGGR